MKLLSGLSLIALLIASTQADTPTPSPKSTPVPTPVPRVGKHSPLIYKMPAQGLAATRHDIDGGSRGWTAKMPALYVLGPNHTGLTASAQPSLFWYQSGPASTPIEVTIVEPGKPKRVFRVRAEQVDQGGIHRLLLSRYDVKLAPGVVYKWTVALVPDPANRSQDLIASDTIERIELDARLTAALASAKGAEKAALYAAKGVWYDALESLTNEIDAAPKDKDLRLLRVSLLEQAGLKEAAASERK